MFPPGWHETVRRHQRQTKGLVLAQSGPCLETRDLEGSEDFVYGRDFGAIDAAALDGLELAESWFLGVLVCPGDDLSMLASWAARLRRDDLDRIRFYVHDDVDLVEAFHPWYAAGLPSPDTEPFVEGPRFTGSSGGTTATKSFATRSASAGRATRAEFADRRAASSPTANRASRDRSS